MARAEQVLIVIVALFGREDFSTPRDSGALVARLLSTSGGDERRETRDRLAERETDGQTGRQTQAETT